MVPFALRSLLYDRTRLAISVGGVALAITLILVLRGIFDGTIAKATLYTERVGADLFVTQQGVEHMAMASPVLPAAAEARIAAAPGVAEARGIVRIPAVLAVGGHFVTASIVGFAVEGSLGGPWSMAAGSAQPGPDGIVIDETMAREQGVGIGDEVVVAGHAFVIAGLSRETNALAVGRVVFVRRETAQALLQSPEIVNFVLVRLESGADVEAAAAALREAVPGVAVITREALVASDRALFRSLFGAPVDVMAVIGLLVGLLVIGLATYAAAAERTRDFGVLKAIGASNPYLARVVVELALIIALSGFVLGLALSAAAGPLIVRIAPELGVALHASYAVRIFGAALALSLVSSLAPVWRIGNLDPKEVFS